ncbi:hypothetical protein BpHYR1_039022 [Brachionus plicatilis]|uniref:Uncharacterized protein n=1 Tax=Brachionus plicatilis TaxID=10195 RepID=A0A3M7RMV5_BRAPC|nr:hypothetical protein BpHYR1_039022 [Brachionus plicatilis]
MFSVIFVYLFINLPPSTTDVHPSRTHKLSVENVGSDNIGQKIKSLIVRQFEVHDHDYMIKN